ncbi:MAG: tyrosine-type recombinase/integrase [Clostridia bacterium]
MEKSYIATRNKKNMEALSRISENLPDCCFQFLVGMEGYTSPLTRLNYACDLSIFFQFLSENVFKKNIKKILLEDINNLKSIDIESFLNNLNYYQYHGKNFSNGERAKGRKLATIRSFLKFHFNKDNIKSNVASKVATPKLHEKEIIRLEPNEVVKIINLAENPGLGLSKKQSSYENKTAIRDTAILTILLGTGIRVSECVGLNILDIDFESNAFKITRKGGNRVVLYFSNEIGDSLKKWIEKREEMADENNPENALFLSLQKKRLCVKSIENIVKKYAKVISPLKNISPHKLRSTYGTNLYRETGDIYIVAEVLGHKDVNTTKKHYAAISDDIRRDAAEKVKLR